MQSAFAAEPTIGAWTFVTYGAFQVEGRSVPFIGVGPASGPIEPLTITRGRAPSAPDEVALGASTRRRLRTDIGDRLTIDGLGTGLRVVGEAVFPGIGQLDAPRASLGTGAALTGEGAGAIIGGEINPDGVLVELHPGGRKRLQQLFRGFVLIDGRAPGTLRAWSSLRALTAVSAVGLAALALASVVHARLLARRVQTVELAVLEALGMHDRQLRRSLRWQSVMLLSTGVLTGAPLGILVGVHTWFFVADELTAESPPRLLSPHLALSGAVLALITIVVALTARRRGIPPATTLRTE